MKLISVLVIDDSALMRKLLTDIINADPGMEVVGVAEDPYVARDQIKLLNPDVLTLDIEMPKMNGITFLRNLMRLRPMPVVMVSTLTEKGASATLESMELGALDYVAKSTLQEDRGIAKFSKMVLEKVLMASQANVNALAKSSLLGRGDGGKPKQVHYSGVVKSTSIIAIGSSTGGTEALNQVLSVMPAESPPILIAQHIPPTFSTSLARRLNEASAMTVVEASDGMEVKKGHAYLAPGNFHLAIRRRGHGYICRIIHTEKVNRHRPSVDVLFDSMVKEVGKHATGVILTGMGADGAQGLLRMREAGCHTIGQDEASSVVYGMPRAAKELGAVEFELPLAKIPSKMLRLSSKPKL
ncbi:MAG TPA: chemotaxis response regulator protein-glutamate methylesterase [Oceanospirillaceae bacterium]|nr:chemotaxis response regulator protein-glutamate methylesterase [Oceanospirillaceae bacterium]